ncbi:MAG: hypothetical protein WA821_10070 [Anaerolineales bacterium]
MKRMGLIASILLGSVVAISVLATGVLNRFLSQFGPPQSPLDVALTTMLTSPTRWQSVDGEAGFLWYGDDGKTQLYINQFAITQPDKFYVNVIDNTGAGADGMWISDGRHIYGVNKKAKTYAQDQFPENQLDASNLPTRLSQVTPGAVIKHPLAGLINGPIAEYLFPTWFPQANKADQYAFQKEDTLLGRKVWVVTLQTGNNDDLTAWVDQETGIILKYNQLMGGKKFLEMTFTAFHVNGKLPPGVFGPPPGYVSSSPQIPVREISTAAPAAPTPLASPSPEQQKKNILLIYNVDKRRYYLSDFSGAPMTPLDLPAEIDGISLSPDGRAVAYIPSTYKDPAAIYLLDINSKKTTKLTNSDDITLGLGLPGWSPDSQEIAFSCWVHGDKGLSLCSVDRTGTIKVLVKSEALNASDMPDGARSPSWSADGSQILFLSSRSPVALGEGTKTEVPNDLWLFDVARQQAKCIFVSGTAGISMIGRGISLPDENAILFSGRKDSHNTIFKYTFDTQKIQDVTASGKRYDLDIAALGPDGKTFVTTIPLSDDGTQYVPVLYSVDGALIRQLDALKNLQVVSWGQQ